MQMPRFFPYIDSPNGRISERFPSCWKALQALDQDTEKKQEEAQVPAQDSCEVYGAYIYIYICVRMLYTI